MALLGNISICVSDLSERKANFTKGKNGKQYYNVTVSVNDDTDQYGNNIKLIESQTKEDRDNGKKKIYLGNGGVFWNDGQVSNAAKSDSKPKEDDFSLDF